MGSFGSHVLRLSSSRVPLSVVRWIDVVPVPWIAAVPVLETDVVPLRTMMVECSTRIV